MYNVKTHYFILAVITLLLVGVMGCEEALQDALGIEVDVNEPLFNDTYNASVTRISVASNLIVSNNSVKAMKVSGFGSADFVVEDTRKLLFSLDFGSVTVEGDIVNSSSTVETISFYFSTDPGLSDPVSGGADLIFSEDLAPGSNVINESLTDGVSGLNQPDATVTANLKAFVGANQGQDVTYTVYAVISDGAEDVTINSFTLDIGAVYLQTEIFTSDSLDKYSSENAQLEDGYIEGSVTVNGSAVTTFKIYLGDTGGLYPPASQIVAGVENVGPGSTFAMSKSNKAEYMVNETLLNEKLTQLSNGTVSSVEANLYIYSGASLNVTLNSAIRGTLTLGD